MNYFFKLIKSVANRKLLAADKQVDYKEYNDKELSEWLGRFEKAMLNEVKILSQ